MEPLFELGLEPIRKGARDGATHLYRQLHAAILDGRLAAGSRLPPTRSAGAHFGVSRNTAIDVYERLLHERLVIARHGSGTYVAPLPTALRPIAPAREPGVTDPRLNSYWQSDAVSDAIGYWQHRDEAPAIGDHVIDLRPAVIDSRLFPFDRLRQSFTLQLRRMENRPARFRGPRGNQGNFHLRGAIAGHVAVTRAVACEPGDILVTSGAQQAFDLIARALVKPGQTRVAIEDPGYPPMRVPFAAAGAAIVPVPVDDEGIRVDLIPRDVQIVCTCPSHHFPLGVPLSPDRRADLLRFARETGAVIVEDDYDGEFRYDGSPLTALRTADASDVVFYVGTFSKTMLPSLRLGFVIPPGWALDALIAAKNALDWHASSPLQLGVASFIAQGHLTRHVARMRQVYGERRRTVLDAVAATLPRDVRALPTYHGMHLTLISSAERDLETVSRRAKAVGLEIHGLARYFAGAATRDGLVVGFGTAGIAELAEAIERLGDLLRS
ncbi:MAG: PLP-dependent aminotransferase family protein [Sphingomonas sp.]